MMQAKTIGLTAILAVLTSLPAAGQCPPARPDIQEEIEAHGFSRWQKMIEVSPGVPIAFPVKGSRVTHEGSFNACVYDESGELIPGMGFDLRRVEGEFPQGRGLEASDLRHRNPTGSIVPIGPARQVETTDQGELFVRNLVPGQYVLEPDWHGVDADRVAIYYHYTSSISADIPIEWQGIGSSGR